MGHPVSIEEKLHHLNSENTRVHIDNLYLIAANEILRREHRDLRDALKRLVENTSLDDQDWGYAKDVIATTKDNP